MELLRQEVYGGDLETDNDPYNNLEGFIFQYALSDGHNALTGTNGNDFLMDAKRVLDNSGFKEIFIYFHNLSYDIEFLLPAIYNLGTIGVSYQIYRRRGGVSTFKLVFPDKQTITFRNSASKLPSALKDVGEMIGCRKLEGFDFFPGWSQFVDLDDDANWEYVKRDAEIVAKAMMETHANGFDKATTSGDAFKTAKDMHSEKVEKLYGWKSKDKRVRWTNMFPKITRELDAHLRLAYLGGINLSNNRGLIVSTPERPIRHFDVVSMYSSVMKYDTLPYGLPTVSFEPPLTDSLYVRKFKAKIHIKDGMTPWYRFNLMVDYVPEGLKHSEPVKTCKEFHIFTLTNVDIESLEKFYHIEYDDDFVSTYHIFKSNVGWFSEYIDRFMKMKQNSVKGTLPYLRAKLMMNGLYGRFGLSSVNEVTVLERDSSGAVSWSTTEEINDDNDAYLPYAMFVTAHARRRLLNGVSGLKQENLIHADTDSLIFIGDIPNTITIGDEVGNWGIEGKPVKYMYEGGFKRYIKVYSDNITSIKDISMACAGVPSHTDDNGCPIGMWIELLDNPSLIAEDAQLGKESYQVKSPWLRDLLIDGGYDPDSVNTFKNVRKRVKNGVYLSPTTFTMGDNANAFRLIRK